MGTAREKMSPIKELCTGYGIGRNKCIKEIEWGHFGDLLYISVLRPVSDSGIGNSKSSVQQSVLTGTPGDYNVH